MQASYTASDATHVVIVVRETCGACQVLFQHLKTLMQDQAVMPCDVWLVKTDDVQAVPALTGVQLHSVPLVCLVRGGAVVSQREGVHPSAQGMLGVLRGMLTAQ